MKEKQTEESKANKKQTKHDCVITYINKPMTNVNKSIKHTFIDKV